MLLEAAVKNNIKPQRQIMSSYLLRPDVLHFSSTIHSRNEETSLVLLTETSCIITEMMINNNWLSIQSEIKVECEPCEMSISQMFRLLLQTERT